MPARRRCFVANELEELWRHWSTCANVSEVARRLQRPIPSVYSVLRERGGIAPRARRQRLQSLSIVEREEISRQLALRAPLRAIARQLGRAPSTISREVARNGGRDTYRAHTAQQRAAEQARRPQPCKLARSPRLCDRVRDDLRHGLSPEQIQGRLRVDFPNDPEMRISPETIYRTLYIQARGTLKKDLVHYLRRARAIRTPQTRTTPQRETIPNAIPISQRPAEADDRAIPGHWEGDLLIGSIDTQIATLVERTTRYVLLIRLDQRTATTVTHALTTAIKRLPPQLRRSLTWDRGGEMAKHAEISIATGIQIYFCDPKSPWQRGSNENTNGLLRQYFPKGHNLAAYDQTYLDDVAHELNIRPRKTLGFHTPAERLAELLNVAPTG